MNILMLSPIFPWPLDIGSRIRIYNILKEMSKRHKITLLSLTDRKNSADGVEEVQRLCSKLIVVPGIKSKESAALRSLFSIKPYRVVKFNNNSYQEKVNRILDEVSFDVIWGNLLNMMSYIDPCQTQRALVVLDQQNVDELVWSRFAGEGNWATRIFAAHNLWKLRRFERQALTYIDLVISVSEADAEFMKPRITPPCQVWTIPNGVDIDYFCPSSREERERKNLILFCGSMHLTMNIDAVLGFANNIFPSIKKGLPDLEFWIVGSNPDERVKRLSRRDGITVKGDVEDVRPYYEMAKLTVAPFRYGGGTKLKILESMAMGVPVVSTSIGSQGIAATNGVDIIIEDNQKVLGNRILFILQSKGERTRIATNARKLVEERYSWKILFENLDQRLTQLLKDRGALQS